MQCFAVTCLYRINMNECQQFFFLGLDIVTKATINVLIVQQLSINFGWTEFCVLSVLSCGFYFCKLTEIVAACIWPVCSTATLLALLHQHAICIQLIWVFITYAIFVHLYVSHFRMNLLVKNINGKIAIKLALGLIMMSCNLASFFCERLSNLRLRFSQNLISFDFITLPIICRLPKP